MFKYLKKCATRVVKLCKKLRIHKNSARGCSSGEASEQEQGPRRMRQNAVYPLIDDNGQPTREPEQQPRICSTSARSAVANSGAHSAGPGNIPDDYASPTVNANKRQDNDKSSNWNATTRRDVYQLPLEVENPRAASGASAMSDAPEDIEAQLGPTSSSLTEAERLEKRLEKDLTCLSSLAAPSFGPILTTLVGNSFEGRSDVSKLIFKVDGGLICLNFTLIGLVAYVVLKGVETQPASATTFTGSNSVAAKLKKVVLKIAKYTSIGLSIICLFLGFVGMMI